MYDHSIRRAEILLGPLDAKRALVVKLSDDRHDCSIEWRGTWDEVGRQLDTRLGERDRDTLVTLDGVESVLELHESGPEILTFVGAAADAVTVAGGVATLVAMIAAARRKEAPADAERIRLKVSITRHGLIDQTTMVEAELPGSADVTDTVVREVVSAIRASRT